MTSAREEPVLAWRDGVASLTQLVSHCNSVLQFWKDNGVSSLEYFIGGLTKLGIMKMFAIRRDFERSPLRENVREKSLSERLNLFHLLSITISFDATHPRDRIYALLGLCNQEERTALAPDLIMSVKDV